VSAIVVVLVLVLLSGGNDRGGEGGSDPSGDVRIEDRPRPPTDPSLADITDGSVTHDGGDVVLEATLADPVPESVDNGSLELRWEIGSGGSVEWIVIATVDVERNASVVATAGDYSSSTVDGTLPGGLEVDGRSVTVRLNRDELPNFTADPEWKLLSSLDGDRASSRSALATDRLTPVD
jgi:hypothetical protein